MFKKMKSAISIIAITTLALGSEWKHVPVNLAITHGLSVGNTIANDDEKVVSNLMLNVLTGEVDSIQGVALGYILNQVNEGVEGVSMAGIGSITGGDINGIQASGIFNTSEQYNGLLLAGVANVSDTGIGVQYAGITNVSQSSFGLQMGGISNHSNGYLIGVQAAGIFNSARTTKGIQTAGIGSIATSLEGIQSGGIFNIAGNSTGAQLAGIYNHSKDIKGAQVAGIASKADNVTGAQISGIANVAKTVDGLQLGLINIADKNNGAAIGLISIDKSYGVGFMGWTDEQLFINAGLRTGSRKLYNLLFVGVRPDEKPYVSVGAGLGKRFAITDNFSVDLDATAQYIGQQKEKNSSEFNEHFQNRVRLFADFRLTRELGIFAGPTFNTTVSKKGNELDFLNSSTSYVSSSSSSDYTTTLSPGFVLGVRIN